MEEVLHGIPLAFVLGNLLHKHEDIQEGVQVVLLDLEDSVQVLQSKYLADLDGAREAFDDNAGVEDHDSVHDDFHLDSREVESALSDDIAVLAVGRPHNLAFVVKDWLPFCSFAL